MKTEEKRANRRVSPVAFAASPAESEERDGWQVILRYENEGEGPWLVDLSHRARWDVQDGRIDALRFGGVSLPQEAGQCRLQDGLLINRMNRTQAAVWHLGGEEPADMPAEPVCTDVGEATLMLAMIGPHVFDIGEKLSALDFAGTRARPPFLVQGPMAHVPCQIVVAQRNAADAGGALLWTCSRGYGRSMVHAVLEAGHEFGLRPAGERRFSRWLESGTR